MARHYSLVTVWHLNDTIEHIWEAITHPERWPDWWPSVLSVVELEAGAADGVGAERRFTWRGPLPYSLTFDIRVTEAVQHRRLVGRVSGDLQGTGSCTLQALPGATRVRYDWNVATGKAWMNALGPLLDPVFRWNHEYVMRLGGQCLAQRLRCRLGTGEDIPPNPADYG